MCLQFQVSLTLTTPLTKKEKLLIGEDITGMVDESEEELNEEDNMGPAMIIKVVEAESNYRLEMKEKEIGFLKDQFAKAERDKLELKLKLLRMQELEFENQNLKKKIEYLEREMRDKKEERRNKDNRWHGKYYINIEKR